MERCCTKKVPKSSARSETVARKAAAPSPNRHPIARIQRAVGNQAVQRLINSPVIQAKLQVSSPGDPFEREADQVASTVMRKALPTQMEEDEEKVVQAKADGSPAQASPSANNVESTLSSGGGGSRLPDSVRSFMEPRFGRDFGHVNVHTGSDAIQMNRAVGSQAFTNGSNIYFGAGYSPTNLELTAHELTHVVQQTGDRGPRGTGAAAVSPKLSIQRMPEAQIQRRLIVSGSSEALVQEYLGVVGTAAGLRLNWTFATPRVTNGGNLPGPVPSPTGRTDLLRVINHPTQNAELHIGRNQPSVLIGAFPTAPSTIQTIDMDDIRNLNANLPGQGTAFAFHEMIENFNHHGAGAPGLGPSHIVGSEAESNVLEEQGIAGRRLGGGTAPTVISAPPGQPTGPNIIYRRVLAAYTHYFLEIIHRVTTGSPTGPGADFEIISARRIPKVQVSQRTINGFTSGSTAIPLLGNVILALTLADLNANPNSTVLIEGFSDSIGAAAGNVTTSRNRAATAQAFFIANGINANRIAIVGRGETNFVATNANEAGRSQNRRIQLTVHRP